MITETWILSSIDDKIKAQICCLNVSYYKLHNIERKGLNRGGGIAVMLTKHSVTQNGALSEVKKIFEYILVKCQTKQKTFEIMGIYRPPGKNTISQFLDELSDLLEEIKPSASSLLILTFLKKRRQKLMILFRQ